MSPHTLAAGYSGGNGGYQQWNECRVTRTAIRILGAGIPHLVRDMETYMKEMEKEVLGKVEKLELVG